MTDSDAVALKLFEQLPHLLSPLVSGTSDEEPKVLALLFESNRYSFPALLVAPNHFRTSDRLQKDWRSDPDRAAALPLSIKR